MGTGAVAGAAGRGLEPSRAPAGLAGSARAAPHGGAVRAGWGRAGP